MPKHRRNPGKISSPRGSPSKSPRKQSTRRRHQHECSTDSATPPGNNQENVGTGLPGSVPPPGPQPSQPQRSSGIRSLLTFASFLAFAKRGSQRDVETQMSDGSSNGDGEEKTRKGSSGKSTGERPASSSGSSSVPPAIPRPSSSSVNHPPGTVAFSNQRGGCSKSPDVSIQMPSSSGSSGDERRRKNDKDDAVNFSDSTNSSSGRENSPKKSSPTWRKRMKQQISEREKKMKAAMEKDLLSTSTDKDDSSSSGWEDIPQKSPTKMRKLYIKQLNKRTVRTKASNRKLFRRLVKKATLTLIEKNINDDDDHVVEDPMNPRRSGRTTRSKIDKKKLSPQPVGLVDCALFFYLNDLSVVGLCRSFGQKRPKCLVVFAMACFVIFHILAFIDIWFGLKGTTLYFLGNEHRTDNLLNVVQTVCYAILMIVFFCLLTFGWDNVTDVLRIMRFKMYTELEMKNRHKWHQIIARLLFAKSVGMSLFICIYGIYAPNGWSMERLNRINNYQMHENLDVWNTTAYSNVTDLLRRQMFFGDYDEISSGFTVIRCLLTFCGCLQGMILDDFMQLIAISMLEHVIDFIKIMISPRFSLARTWAAYEELKAIFDKVNDTFMILVPFYHIRNFFLLPQFLIGAWKKIRHFGILGDGLRVINVAIFYTIGFFTSHKAKEISKWIKGLCRKGSVIILNGVRITVQFMMDCSNNDKLGLGLDEFFVSQSFIIWFVGVVISIFLILVDKHDADKKKSE